MYMNTTMKVDITIGIQSGANTKTQSQVATTPMLANLRKISIRANILINPKLPFVVFLFSDMS
jgi:hypothetical protein